MIYIISADGKSWVSRNRPQDAEDYLLEHNLPDGHAFFVCPDSNPLITVDSNGVYHYQGQPVVVYDPDLVECPHEDVDKYLKKDGHYHNELHCNQCGADWLTDEPDPVILIHKEHIDRGKA